MGIGNNKKRKDKKIRNRKIKSKMSTIHETDLPGLSNTKSHTRHKQNIKEVATAQPTRCGVKQGSATHEGGPFGGEETTPRATEKKDTQP